MRRFLEHPSNLKLDDRKDSTVLVIGGGVAGLSAAIAASQETDVLLVAKSWLSDSNTDAAQGGVAAVLDAQDAVENHVADTLAVGHGLCHEALVRRVVQGGPAAITRLVEWGGQFDRSTAGNIALGLEAGHSAERIVHAMGDSTGREIQRVLVDRARRCPRLTIMEHAFVVDLVVSGGRAAGAILLSGGRFGIVRAGVVICATGGSGQIYRETTNPDVATGDGHSILFRAGARLRGMEFFQFHPTTLYVAGSSRLLISEAARGEGGILRDCHGTAFMDTLHPRGELAPRDLLSRAIVDQMRKTQHPNVFLDLRHLPPAFVRGRFPRIYRVCLTFGLDITRDLIPVTPAAHYVIGGAVVDADGRTSIPYLYAVGEVACSGLHGANRLASNSLLEGLVLGDHAGKLAPAEAKAPSNVRDDAESEQAATREVDRDFNPTDLANSMKALMWRKVGIVRNGVDLADADRRLEGWQRAADRVAGRTPRDFELRNQLMMARLVTLAARERAESRGVHFRDDFPQTDDAAWRVDLELKRSAAGEVEIARVRIPGSQPAAQSDPARR